MNIHKPALLIVAVAVIGSALGITIALGVNEAMDNGVSPPSAASSSAAPTTTKSPEQIAVENKAITDRLAAQKAEEALNYDWDAYEVITARDFALMAKNPSAWVGRRIRVAAKVMQFDSSTGTNSFLAYADGTGHYAVDELETLVSVTAAPNCYLGDVVEDDYAYIYAKVAGVESYDTRIGGHNTVPRLTAYDVALSGD